MSKIEVYWEKKDYIKFEIELKKFIGYICRKFFQGFRQSTELFEEVKDRIVIKVYNNLFANDFEITKIRINILKLLNKYNKWNEFNKLFGVNFQNMKERKKYIKEMKFGNVTCEKCNGCLNGGCNILLDKLNIVDDIKFINFTSYLFTTIRGELTKFFNKYNRERKHVNFDDVSNVLKSKTNDIDKIKDFIVVIEEIIKENGLSEIFKAEEALEFILYSEKIPFNYKKISYLRLISWNFIKKYWNLPDIQQIQSLNHSKSVFKF